MSATAPPPHAGSAPEPGPSVEAVRAALAQVVDPEMGVNIVDLGLVYRIEWRDKRLEIDITLTSPSCPMGELIADEALDALAPLLAPDATLDLRLVRDPPWHPGLMSERARRTLGE